MATRSLNFHGCVANMMLSICARLVQFQNVTRASVGLLLRLRFVGR
jgi:hypothetical protein